MWKIVYARQIIVICKEKLYAFGLSMYSNIKQEHCLCCKPSLFITLFRYRYCSTQGSIWALLMIMLLPNLLWYIYYSWQNNRDLDNLLVFITESCFGSPDDGRSGAVAAAPITPMVNCLCFLWLMESRHSHYRNDNIIFSLA